jgi:glycosyltransferase involved in cell wall biosynthesis
MVLVVFFTRSVSLDIWLSSGLLDREKLIYEEYLNRGYFKKVYWITYGYDDYRLSNQLKNNNMLHPDINIVNMPFFFKIPKIGSYLYSILAPFLHLKILLSANFFKTIQMDGSWCGVIAKWLYRKPLVVRTGYTLSVFLKNNNTNTLIVWLSSVVESFSYQFCDAIVVSSRQDKRYLIDQYKIFQEKINVIPNYVDISIFKPLHSHKYKNRLLFIGRLTNQKNIFNLIDAVSMKGMILDIYGKGKLKNNLELYANKKGLIVNFNKTVPNSELPKIMNCYRFYILPSFYEGTPKTLLEAMACGLVCIGTNIEGIKGIIEDEVSGYLIKGTDAKSIFLTLDKATKQNKNSIGSLAIKTIHENYNLTSYLLKENDIFFGLLENKERMCN